MEAGCLCTVPQRVNGVWMCAFGALRSIENRSREPDDFAGVWLRGLDSNQDNQIQSLVCYQLHYPGAGAKIVNEHVMIPQAGSGSKHAGSGKS
jgi:hypothetical protein